MRWQLHEEHTHVQLNGQHTLLITFTVTSRPSCTSSRKHAGFCFLRRRLHKQQHHQMQQAQKGQGPRSKVVVVTATSSAVPNSVPLSITSPWFSGSCGRGGIGGGREYPAPCMTLQTATVPSVEKAATTAAGQPSGPVPLAGRVALAVM